MDLFKRDALRRRGGSHLQILERRLICEVMEVGELHMREEHR